ncbi:MAG: biotin--[acetyl-CoA-carboxylase] ligase [Desulfurococcaceae archaeon]
MLRGTAERALLELMISRGGEVMVGEAARALGLAPGDVEAAAEGLRALGYLIERVPGPGYRLASFDDMERLSEVLGGLRTRIPYEARFVKYCESTQDLARELAEAGAREGTVVIAGVQARGRGRLGRHWHSGEGGLWMTLVLRPELGAPQLLTLGAGLALARSIRRALGIEAELKWPNDVLYGGKKLAGILAEASAESGRVRYVLLGVGVNVNNEVPSELKGLATSLREAIGVPVPRTLVLKGFLEEFDEVYGLLAEGRGREVLEGWAALSSTIGRRVKVILREGELEGIARGLGDDGSLLVELPEGVTVSVNSGDVVHLR